MTYLDDQSGLLVDAVGGVDAEGWFEQLERPAVDVG